MTRLTRPIAVAAGLLAASAVIAVTAATVGAKSNGKATSGKLYVAVTPRVKSGIEYVAGEGTDKVLGSIAVTFTIKPLSTSSGKVLAKAIKVTEWASGGTLTGTGSATLNITNAPKAGDATATGGVVSLTKGTGTLKGHSISTKFSGSGNIVSGEYTFSYTGTYK